MNISNAHNVSASMEGSPDSSALLTSPASNKKAAAPGGRGGRGGGGAKRPAAGSRSGSKSASDVHSDILGADASAAGHQGEGEGHPQEDSFPYPGPPSKKRHSGAGVGAAAGGAAGAKGHHHHGRSEISTHLEGDGSFSGSLLNPYASSKAKQARSHLHPVEILKALYVELEAQGLDIYGSDKAMTQIPLRKVIEREQQQTGSGVAAVKMEEDTPAVQVKTEGGEGMEGAAADPSDAAAAATAAHRSSPVLNLLSVVGGQADVTTAAASEPSSTSAAATAAPQGVEAKPVAVSRAASTVSLVHCWYWSVSN